MSTRTDLPKIKPDDQPSIFNHEAGEWGIYGGLLSIIPSVIAYMSGCRESVIRGIGIAGTVGGALYGGLKGKAQQEKEAVEGRVVKDPGYWNKGLLSGWLISGLIQAPFHLMNKSSTLVGFLLTATTMTIGSISRKNSLQHDFDKAVALRDGEQAQLKQMVHSVAKEREPHHQPGFKDTVSADEAARLEQQQQPTASHVEQLQQSAVAEAGVQQR